MKQLIIILGMIQGLIALSHCQNNGYDRVLTDLGNKRVALVVSDINEPVTRQCSDLLYSTLTGQIFPAWNCTPWDFNGTSNTPGEGQIACGYFVSTTLKHAGFNLNRYKLAQQASAVIVDAVCGDKQVKRLKSPAATLKHLKSKKKGLFIVGLEYHVGFLVVERETVYFVHSDYINSKVVREKAAGSQAFNSSGVFVVGEVTNNAALMKKWLQGTRIY